MTQTEEKLIYELKKSEENVLLMEIACHLKRAGCNVLFGEFAFLRRNFDEIQLVYNSKNHGIKILVSPIRITRGFSHNGKKSFFDRVIKDKRNARIVSGFIEAVYDHTV